jgi:hypothetical protein
MGHDYMREYDEDRGDNRDRWHDDDRERGWRGREWSDRGNERNRNFMLGDRDRSWERDSRPDRDRGFFDRTADEARSWYREDDRDARRRARGRFGGRDDCEQAPRNFGSGHDDHYRSWRDRQMEALDRDYADYCREREQQFHSDFDTWRSQRQGNQGPLRTGMTQTAQTGDPTGELELSKEMADPTQNESDPMASATLGTTSSRNRR